MNLKKGFIQIYTGNGKGKTTAAIGQAIRAAGHGMRTCFIQFMKNYPYGEIKSLERYSDYITIRKFGNDDFVLKKEPPGESDLEIAEDGFNYARVQLLQKEFDIVILDEICVAIYFELFTTDKVLDLFKIKPEQTELILTGRYCPQNLIEKADLVTEMNEIKHYYSKGVTARKGIES